MGCIILHGIQFTDPSSTKVTLTVSFRLDVLLTSCWLLEVIVFFEAEGSSEQLEEDRMREKQKMSRRWVDAGIVLEGGILEVVLNEKDSSLPLKLDPIEKKIADSTGKNTQLRLSKQRINAVGDMIKTNDGRIYVDNTFEAILHRRERALRLKIAQILFDNWDALNKFRII